MNNKQYHDELEGLLSESADDLRMYPSDRVWRNINKELHGDKQWPALNFGAVLTGTIMLAALLFLQPNKDLFTVKPFSAAVPKTPKSSASTFTVAGRQIEATYKNAGRSQVHTPHAIAQEVLVDVTTTNTTGTVPDENATSLLIPGDNHTTDETGVAKTGTNIQLLQDWQPLLFAPAISAASNETSVMLPSSLAAPPNERNETPLINPELPSALSSPVLAAAMQKMAAKKGRWSIQYYATPSFSYRLLAEEKSQLSSMMAPSNPAATLNGMVRHRAKTGVEAGVAFAYSVTDYFKVKVGVQANYRRYAIDAYNTNAMQPAVLMVNQGLRLDTMMSMTDVSTVPGGKPIEMSNQLMQLSVPLGFELQMASFKQARFVVAASIQPTYNIGQQSWLISADYLNYVKQPSLLRQWNINTGIEAFIRFSGKKGLNWQVGPQIRYQMLPGAVRTYPVREHLIDYGLKIGVSKSL